jgi:RNA polymerase sigma-70 factor (ECF subfamily)
VRTWVYGICIRVASDYRRRAEHRHEKLVEGASGAKVAEEPALDGVVPADQEAEIDRRRALIWLDQVLDRLEDAKRAVFVLYEIEQVPMAEVAEAVGCPLPTAYARLYAARKHVEAAARRRQAQRSCV